MLVTFRSKAGGNVIMFGEVAVKLLQMMGHSGTVPGALLAADIPAALARLKQELAAVSAKPESGHDIRPDSDDPDASPPVALALRAFPLIQLLSAAARREYDVMWEASRATD